MDDCSTLAGTNQGGRKECGRTNRQGDCSTSAGTNPGGRKERGETPPRPELIQAGGRSVARRIVEARGDVFGLSDFFKVIFIAFRVEA